MVKCRVTFWKFLIFWKEISNFIRKHAFSSSSVHFFNCPGILALMEIHLTISFPSLLRISKDFQWKFHPRLLTMQKGCHFALNVPQIYECRHLFNIQMYFIYISISLETACCERFFLDFSFYCYYLLISKSFCIIYWEVFFLQNCSF